MVELEWTPNPERDVTGYQVYRVTGGSVNLDNDVKVCSTSVTDANPTACADTNAPSSGNPRYYVLALAPARAPATGTERSALPAYASTLQADARNTAADGADLDHRDRAHRRRREADVDGGDRPDLTPIRYYRIYREDGSSINGRFDTSDTGGIVTVDRQLARRIAAQVLGKRGRRPPRGVLADAQRRDPAVKPDRRGRPASP